MLGPAEIQIQLNVHDYISLVAFTLLYYDFCLTIPREVSRYWGTRLTWPTFLFYLNRYASISGTAPVIVEYFLDLAQSKSAVTYHQVAAIIAQIVVGAMLVTRTYALYGQSPMVLVFMLLVASGALGFGAWSLVYTKQLPTSPQNIYPLIGCGTNLSMHVAYRLGHAWMGMLVFDCMIFILTARKACQNRQTSGERRGGLVPTLLRDGALYFFLMGMANSGNIISFMFAGPYLRGVGTTVTNVLSSILITRLMLNLRDPKLIAAAESTVFPDMDITTFEPYYGTGVSAVDNSEPDNGWIRHSNEGPL
ncbi:hypothetical protein MSAN_01733200 [Mycena sanguinolenta]|uniref:DUF6533 domain-containing protein n=1 Tax=Mycena sanguinolenta TaxID=230812 RepID=A0A8H6XXK0_9AGAR|nr:hypothetical protein MSAN_01733200 [Mycena sanguinolenta]